MLHYEYLQTPARLVSPLLVDLETQLILGHSMKEMIMQRYRPQVYPDHLL